MAQKVLIQLTDDLDPTKEADETVAFSLDGTNYEIDLTSKNADKFRGLFQDHIAAGRKVTGSKGSNRRNGSGPKEDLSAIREWARSKGHKVSDRGRISTEVTNAYNAAH